MPTTTGQQLQQRAYHASRSTMALDRGASSRAAAAAGAIEDPMLAHFLQQDFPVPHARIIHEKATPGGGGIGRGGSSSRAHRGIAADNYAEFLHTLAVEPSVGSNADRILFVDSEINYRFQVPQILVLEAFQPLTRRQRRHKRFKQLDELALGTMTAEDMVRYGRMSPEAVRRWEWERGLRSQNADIASQSQLLERERKLNAREGDAVPSARTPPPLPTTEAAMPQSGDGDAAASAGLANALAVNLEDYTLIALAEMLTELASSGARVREYLKVEPLVEKLHVPMYGEVNYLPIENCDYIEELDWPHIKVVVKGEEEERLREEAKEQVVETEEHKDLFQ
ncbi:hypothetical protein STCU_09158 [Strigomonas culicis]|uniref:Uncharacterized protein n=1 Tax=Strigomonas culicis TaxID=28005 RepID=S9UZR0_9TRYP|nr:hypothetical protein STCU_09158 [Strigomonas culicis]|eukprot:EPY20096.1 hypothetical protein STCU_09158 [Strigomonas culicis]